MFGGIVALEKQLIKVRSEASDTRLDIADVIQSIDVLPALRSVASTVSIGYSDTLGTWDKVFTVSNCHTGHWLSISKSMD